MSPLQPVKLLLLRPDSMTPRQSMHEAWKVLASAGVLAGGIALEEVVATQLALVPGVGLYATASAAAWLAR